MRLDLAAETGALVADSVTLVYPPVDVSLSLFGEANVSVVQDRMPEASHWQARGLPLVDRIDAELAVVFLPRAKQDARDKIAKAAEGAARVVVDGPKTHGVEALMRDISKRTDISGPISKAHGKIFWFDGSDLFSDWHAGPKLIDGKWSVPPGVFSADGIDPGSRLLADALASLTGAVADLGAGWGYLAGCALEKSEKIKALHLVEAQKSALDAASGNVRDPRAQFHWADATSWQPPEPLDAVIMNPPFHTGRQAEPELGQRFITSAAAMLRRGGALWMVANRHLPYEIALRERFTQVEEINGDRRYKLFRAVAKGAQRKG